MTTYYELINQEGYDAFVKNKPKAKLHLDYIIKTPHPKHLYDVPKEVHITPQILMKYLKILRDKQILKKVVVLKTLSPKELLSYKKARVSNIIREKIRLLSIEQLENIEILIGEMLEK